MTRTRTSFTDPMIEARRHQERRLAFIAVTVVLAVFAVLIMVSDVILRSKTYHGTGENPNSWDVVGTAILIVWAWMVVQMWRSRR